MAAISQCPICRGLTKPYDDKIGINADISCENCGDYIVSYQVVVDRRVRNMSTEDRAYFSGWLRDRWRRGEEVGITSHDIDPILNDVRRLSPAEKANHLLVTLARAMGTPGVQMRRQLVRPSDAWALNHEELTVYLHWLVSRQFLVIDASNDKYYLPLGGWVEASRLQKEHMANATLAFMALQFGDPRLEMVVKDYFVPAVKATGFELRRLNEGQPAGLIDDQLRVRLRTARFVIADLTHGNHGAYWEAGFAEGLGRPVIYTCEESVFNHPDRKKGTHFDTNHLVTVLWSETDLPKAAEQLKAHIRATLPTEARLEDP